MRCWVYGFGFRSFALLLCLLLLRVGLLGPWDYVFVFDAFVFRCIGGIWYVGLGGVRVVALGCSGVLTRVLFVFDVACLVLGSWLLVLGVSHALEESLAFALLFFGCLAVPGACCWFGVFWGLDVRVVCFHCCLLGSRFMALGVLGLSSLEDCWPFALLVFGCLAVLSVWNWGLGFF